MRQPSIFLLTFATIFILSAPAYSAVRGGIDYSIPIDYSKLSEPNLASKATDAYNKALLANNKDTEEMTNALMLYSILKNMNPTNIDYSVKLGILYDKIELDKYAKGNLARAIGINPSAPEPYFYMGEFYYKREFYRKALKYYLMAYDRGFQTHPKTLERLSDIYKKFGDSEALQTIDSPTP